MQPDLMTKNLKLEFVDVPSSLTSPKNILLVSVEPLSKEYEFRVYVGEMTEEEAVAQLTPELSSRIRFFIARGLTPVLSNTGGGCHFALNSMQLAPDQTTIDLKFAYVGNLMKIAAELNREKALELLMEEKSWQYITEVAARVWLIEDEVVGLQFTFGDTNWGRRSGNPIYIVASPVRCTKPNADGKTCLTGHSLSLENNYPPKNVTNLRINNFHNLQI